MPAVPAVRQAPFAKYHEFCVVVPVKFSVYTVCALASMGVAPTITNPHIAAIHFMFITSLQDP